MAQKHKKAVLNVVKTMVKSKSDITPPGSVPECPFIYHQPKRPKKNI